MRNGHRAVDLRLERDVLQANAEVTERPVVMHERAAGESKKGHDVLYGLRYGRVLVRTWWRTRRSLAAAASAP